MRASFRVAKQLATARFVEVASGVDLQQAPQLSEEQIAEDRTKKKLCGGWIFFFESAPFLVLTACRGRRLLAPTTICSLGASHVFRYRRGRCASLLLGCPAGPAAWVPSRAACVLGALRRAAWVPSGPGAPVQLQHATTAH